ncbi:MAG: cytochrome c oxidase subunit II, partial [Dechloromonas sp.]|nr:cytochrome c oxidase subunit II [Dechloromonas sp.]
EFGPDLTHLASRHTIGAGVAALTKANVHAWVLDPEHLKPGARMPAMKVKGEPLDQLVDYLMSLK